jgi:hypothetical protein
LNGPTKVSSAADQTEVIGTRSYCWRADFASCGAQYFGKEEAMSGTGLTAVMLMIGTVMLVVSFWRQIAIFMLFVIVAVFCFGVYYIVRTLSYLS